MICRQIKKTQYYCSVFKYKVSCVFGEKLGKCLVFKLDIVRHCAYIEYILVIHYIYMYVHDVLSIIKMFFLRCHVAFTYYRQWQTVAEENAKLRCTIEHYKKQMAEMSKQLG